MMCRTCHGSGSIEGKVRNPWGFVDDVEFKCPDCGATGEVEKQPEEEEEEEAKDLS